MQINKKISAGDINQLALVKLFSMIRTNIILILTLLFCSVWASSFFAQNKIDKDNDDQYIGEYQITPHHFISIMKFDMGGETRLMFLDYDSGDTGLLKPLGDDTFIAGPGLLIDSPVKVQAAFRRNKSGAVVKLIWQPSGFTAQTGKRTKNKYRQESVRFRNGNVTLSGTLFAPLTKGKHSAIVMVHGSGALGRDFFSPMVQLFVRHGFAVLAYDKRGVGASTGDWFNSTLDDLARDALAGVRFLKKRKDINPQQIGMWGISQGGWILPLAASYSKDIAFLILAAAPSVSPEQQELDSVENRMRADGFSQTEIEEALVHTRLLFAVVHRGQGWNRLQASVEQAKSKDWSGYVQMPSSIDEVNWWNRNNYDPAPALKKITCPVLALFGEVDRIVPPSKNLSLMESYLKESGNKDLTIKIIPKASHYYFLESQTGGQKELSHSNRFVPTFFKTMNDWLRRRGFGSK